MFVSLSWLSQTLSDFCNQFSGALSQPMSEVQAKLRALWEPLKLPEARRDKYRWTPGQPLEQVQLDACRRELKRLEGAMSVMKGLEFGEEGGETRKTLAGEVRFPAFGAPSMTLP